MNYEKMYSILQEINSLTKPKIEAFSFQDAQQCSLLLKQLVQACQVYVDYISQVHKKSVEISFSYTPLNYNSDYEYSMCGPFLRIGREDVGIVELSKFIHPDCELAIQCVEDLFIIFDENTIHIPADLNITVSDTKTKTSFTPLIREYKKFTIQ